MASIPFSDFGIKWFEDIVKQVTEWFTAELISGYEGLVQELLSTPLPEGEGVSLVFEQPAESDGVWHGIYEATVAGEVTMLALIILFLCYQGHHFIRIFNYGSAFEARKTRKSSWIGAMLILTWYWLAVLSLYFVEGLTIGLLPSMGRLGSSLVGLLPQAAGTPGLTLVMAFLGGISMVGLKAIFLVREWLLFVYLYGMPFGIAFAYGNIPVLSTIARRLISQFIPLVALPLPAAVLFRGYELLFVGEQQLDVGGQFAQYLVVISLPIITLYATWKTFKYASPLAARAASRTGRGALLAGTVATAGYVGGPKAAAAGARWGSKAAIGSAAATNARSASQTGGNPNEQSQSAAGEPTDGDRGGVPSYRRPENDPGYY